MFIPLYDKNSLKQIKFQYITFILVALNIAIYIFFQSNIIYTNNPQATMSFALVPFELFSEGLFSNLPTGRFDTIPVPEGWTLIQLYVFAWQYFTSLR